MKLLDLLISCLIITLLASLLLGPINKAYHKAQWYILVSSSWHNTTIGAALQDDEPRGQGQYYPPLEMMVSTVPNYKH